LKIAALLIILLTLISCREEEGVWDELTPAEQAALRLRAQSKCLSESADAFNTFKSSSNTKFYTNASAYAAGVTFNHTFKEGSSTTNLFTHKITIWKITATDVYLLNHIEYTSTDEYQFIKIPKATNEAMIDDLQSRYCDRSTGQDDSFSLSTASRTYKYIKQVTTLKKNTSTFTYDVNLLVFLSRYKESRSTQLYDSNGNVSGSATSSTGTLSAGAAETSIPVFNNYASYAASPSPTTLCLVNYSVIPYTTTCDATGATTFLSSEL
jgi:hypothetical protein